MSDPVVRSGEAVALLLEASRHAFGGADGVRDENALESALAQPMHEHFYRQADLHQIAAAYAYHIAENQPYIDGNKRTGLLCALNFLAANGIIADQPVDEFYDAMIAIAEKRLDKPGLAAIFRRALPAAGSSPS